MFPINSNRIIKICGVTHPGDAELSCQLGAHWVGILLSKVSPRYVDPVAAKVIANGVRDCGCTPVGVFVNESLEEIQSLSESTGINHVQLHGPGSLASLSQLPEHFTPIVYRTIDSIPLSTKRSHTLLFDSPQPGSGITFDWESFRRRPPSRPWILAGGLNPDNVGQAIRLLQPNGVDVSSGVSDLNSPPSPKKRSRAFASIYSPSPKSSVSGGPSMIRHSSSPVGYYGRFGGQFMPELLMGPLLELEQAWNEFRNHPVNLRQLSESLSRYAGRPTPLTEVPRFAEAIQGPRIFLKREDLLHTGAHKLNNSLGQCFLAQAMGKTRVIAETGAGQHGVATATACARLGLRCTVFMGSQDMKRQALNVQKMELLGAEVVPVSVGSATLKEAINEALRHWSSTYEDSYYCLGSALGPHPYPEMVKVFQSVIGEEIRAEFQSRYGKLPDQLIACVGGGSNAIGMFAPFLDRTEIQLIGVEAGGMGLAPGQHAARFQGGRPGVLHGSYTYLLQDEDGQVLNTHSISAGLDYPSVGPEHSHLMELGRARYMSVTDAEALAALKLLSKTEGIIPALESSHALAYLVKTARTLDPTLNVVVNLSGRGDKDLPL